MKKKIGCYGSLMIFLLLISCCKAFSQSPPSRITITGTISDTTGKRIEGASIVATGKKTFGTTSDANGRFILDAPQGMTLIISYVGFEEQRITISPDHKTYNIVLHVVKAGESVIVTADRKSVV